MKLLRIEANGIWLFGNKIEIDFYAKQRVNPNNDCSLSNLFKNIYINNVLSFVGINASGKTLALKLISFVIQMMNADPINTIDTKTIFDKSEKINIKTYFYNKDSVYLLSTTIVFNNEKNNHNFSIINEKLYRRKCISIKSKKDLLNFNENDLFKSRDVSNEQQMFLKDDVSIIIILGKSNNIKIFNLLEQTNINTLNVLGNFPTALVRFLDPSIEYIKYNDNKSELELKFFKSSDIITLQNNEKLFYYLSSGTIKGLSVFISAWIALIEGGYLIIDEIENHFNKEIIATLIRFFMDNKLNRKGAVLINSTHYIELLDELDRTDNIYILRNNKGISVTKFNKSLSRNDIKKSDTFKSDIYKGTAPSYNSYMTLKKVLLSGEIVERK